MKPTLKIPRGDYIYGIELGLDESQSSERVSIWNKTITSLVYRATVMKKPLQTFVLFMLVTNAWAEGLEGGVVIALPSASGLSRAIDPEHDRVEIAMMPLIVDKRTGVFKKDSSAGVLVSLDLVAEDLAKKVKTTKIPQLYLANVQDYNAGQVMLPIYHVILSLPALNDATAKLKVQRADLDLTVLRQQVDTTFTSTLREIANLTKTGALSGNPYSEGFRMLTDFVFKLVDPKDDEKNKIERPITGSVSVRLNPGTTGVYGILLSSKTKNEPGMVDITQITNYEFKYQNKPAFVLLVKKKNSTGDYVPLLNTHVMFTLDAFTQKRSPAQPRMIGLGDTVPQNAVNAGMPVSTQFENASYMPEKIKPFTSKLLSYQQIETMKIADTYGVVGTVGGERVWKVSEENLFVSDVFEAYRRRTLLGDTNAPSDLNAALTYEIMLETTTK